MCRHVKSIEIIEFGHAKAQEGVNGAKSEYCVDKQKINITRPYQAALREATGWRDAVDNLRDLQQFWLDVDGQPALARGRAGRRLRGPRQQGLRRAVVEDRRGPRGLFSTAPDGAARRQGRRAQGESAAKAKAATPRRRTSIDRGHRRGSRQSRYRRTAAHDDPALDAIFREGGTLSRALPGFRFRPQQLAMAQAIAPRHRARGQLVAEAGTGTGKTFAYLVPALLYGGKVIISTGTKTLQDQLFERDLPLVRDALAAPVTVALLKGRANYVCHYHLERAAREDRLPSRDDVRHLPKIIAFARASRARRSRRARRRARERVDLAARHLDARQLPRPELPASTATASCMKARKEALDADVVVVNHHLFFADVMLRDEGVAELLPNCNTVILDEAHQLPDTATLFFGEQVTAGQLAELARDAEIVARTAARDVPDLPDAAARARARGAQAAPGGRRRRRQVRRATWRSRARDSRKRWTASPRRSIGSPPSLRSSPSAARRSRMVAGARGRSGARRSRAGATAREADSGFARTTPPAWIRWIDVTPHGFQLQASPLSVAPLMKRQVEGSARAWIFTSATLAVGRDFSHYTSQLGLDDARRRRRGTARSTTRTQACCTCRATCPRPTRRSTPMPSSTRRCRCSKASEGRAFLLFTTLRALAQARERLADALRQRGLDYPLLVQGEGSRSELLVRFRELGNAILLGSASFWEGVDVPGDALSLVVIDKLPFAPPDDPAARGAPRPPARRGRQSVHGVAAAAGGDQPEAGRGTADPHRDRSRRAGDLRSAAHRQAVWPAGSGRVLPPMRRTREEREAVAFLSVEARLRPRTTRVSALQRRRVGRSRTRTLTRSRRDVSFASPEVHA